MCAGHTMPFRLSPSSGIYLTGMFITIYKAQNKQSSDALTRATKQASFQAFGNTGGLGGGTMP